MRIYTRVVYGWQPDGSLKVEESDSFDYEGPIAELKDSPSPPAAPDYAGAARATSAGTVQAAIANNLMARPNVYTPLGSQTWRQTGTQTIPGAEGNAPVDIPTYDQTISMTPRGQGIYEQNERLSGGMGSVAESQIGRVARSVEQPFNTSGLPGQVSSLDRGNFQSGPTSEGIQGQINPQDFDRNQVINSLYGQQTSRLDPQWKQREEATRTQLANQGLVPGGEAYTNAMRDQTFARNDAYNSALNSAIANATAQQQAQFGMAQGAGQFANQAQQQRYGQALTSAQTSNEAERARLAQQQTAGQFQNQARERAIQEQAYLRSLPLAEFNAFRTGAQPQMPQFQPTQYAGGAQGPNMMAATQGQGQYDMGLYNSQVGSTNSFNTGLMSAAAAAAAMF